MMSVNNTNFFVHFLYISLKKLYNNLIIYEYKISTKLISEARDIKTISTDEAYKLTIDNQCNLIDIRDIELEKEEE